MLEFKKYIGPYGIPVYHQNLPLVESVAIDWIIFTGSADDQEVGTEGAYHWFEHVPLRGTVDFPDSMAIKGPFSERAGTIGASTGPSYTRFNAYVHESQAVLALRATTDLWSRPLMTADSIEAERTIIFKEIWRKKSSLGSNAEYEIPRLLWPGHPLGHPGLGSIESLQQLDAASLRRAHERGYAASRAALFVSGSDKAVHAALEEVCTVIPQTPLSERRNVASYGPLPAWKPGEVIQIQTDFAASLVYVLFPQPAKDSSLKTSITREIVLSLIGHGAISSPLYQIIRLKHRLAYTTKTWNRLFPDGGAMGIEVETSADQIEASRKAIVEVLTDPRVRSPERFEEVLTAFEYGMRMRSINPRSFNEAASNQLMEWGKTFNDKELIDLFRSIDHKEAIAWLDSMTPEVARTIIFQGTGKE